MSLHHAVSGEVIDIRPFGDKLAGMESAALVRSPEFEVMRLVLPAGKSVPEHHVPGELSVQCLEGTVEMQAHGRQFILQQGQLIYLAGNVPYAFNALENASLLMTMLRKPKDD
jgi:quercetin dioxygenase-like cupin family protein